MRSRAEMLWVLALLVPSIVGCQQVTPESYLFVARALNPDGERMLLEGVEICETDTTNCTVTDASGEARLRLPANEEVSFTSRKDNYESRLDADVTDDRFGERQGTVLPVRQVTLKSDERAADWYAYMMSEYPMRGVGSVEVYLTTPFEGATFELKGATGKRYYFVEPPADFPATAGPTLEATTSEGAGGFLEVGPGEHQIEVGGRVASCVPDRAWPGDSKNRIRFLVREGHATIVSVSCAMAP